ncbi:MAG: lysophospholipase [Treponema sp.]|nr:lysophospholipase [Treponema sp.]
MRDGMEIFVNRWAPDEEEEVKGLVQLHHGLAEHSMRYDRLGSVLAENGYVLNAYDLRGHGKTAENAEKNGTGLFGKLADKDGFNIVVDDLNEITEDLKKTYPGKKTILFGHSFGSFVSQGYIEKYGKNIDACILCGTAGPQQPLMAAGNFLAKLIKLFRGGNTIVPMLSKLSFGSYCNRIENPETPNDWLSLNKANRQMYEMDNWCGIPLTVSFFCDLTGGVHQIHKAKNMKKVPLDLPILFIWGAEDPVGGYGKTIKNLADIYKKNGVKNIEMIEYPNDRHEILNEDDKEKVEADILNYLAKI